MISLRVLLTVGLGVSLFAGCGAHRSGWEPDAVMRSGDELINVSIADVAWIAGSWVKQSDESRLQEIWSEPDGDCMMGMFRWVKGDALWIYELMTIRAEDGTLVFRFRHFGDDMTAWEPKTEPITYRLVSLGRRQVVFENPEDARHFRYELSRPDDDTLLVRVGANRNGKIGYSEFRYTRH